MLLLLACASEEPAATPVAVAPEPAWPTVLAEDPAPAGFSWQTVRHQSVQARMLVPDGVDVVPSEEDAETPSVTVGRRPLAAVLGYEPRSVWLLHDAPADARRTADTVAWSMEQPDGGLRVVAFARGLRCTIDLSPFDRGYLDQALTVCGSVRPAPLGKWAPPPGASATAVPDGAWVGPRRPEMLGESLLGPYAPKLYAGSFSIAHAHCPDDAALTATKPGEVSVALTRRSSALGPATVRTAQGERGGTIFESSVRVVAPRGDGCCIAEVSPFAAAVSEPELDYVVALCDTTRGLK